MNSSNNINPKPCNYGCNTRIYWNATENTFFEVFSGKRHSCPNRSTKKKSVITQTTTTNNKPKYYNANSRSFTTSVPKPKMSNSLELLQGPIVDIQRKYEILSDIVSEANGKVHGSQSHIVTAANNNSTIISNHIL
ncbi:MAG TPA: hypothetical protein VLA74_10390 [Nitrososphaeraceae archaeon]|nr:hypothetical protein [Nitrososphaeraceae archaeon]